MSTSDKFKYYEIVNEILNNEEFQKRKEYKHHGDISVYDHSLRVSQLSYKLARKIPNMDSRSVAIGGLLHDFYYNPWQDSKQKKPFLKKHGFVHAEEALTNSYCYFEKYMTKKTDNIILRHMFPLNKIPPKYKEAWLVTLIDKYVSLEVLLEPKFFLRLIGIRGES